MPTSFLNLQTLRPLILVDSNSDSVKEFFLNQIGNEYNSELRIDKNSCQKLISEGAQVFEGKFSPLCILIGAILSWLGRPATVDELKSIAEPIWSRWGYKVEGFSSEFDKTLEHLLTTKIITQDGQNYLSGAHFYLLGPQLSSHSDIMHTILKTTDRNFPAKSSPQPPRGIYRTGLTEFPPEHVQELQERISMLSNWVSALSRQTRGADNYKANEVCLLKYDFFFNQVIRPN